MSHFSRLAADIIEVDVLVEGLKSFGFDPEVHENPVPLYGYQGDKRATTANVVVRRDQISGMSNDLGFLWNEKDSRYDTVISDYDAGCGSAYRGRGLGPEFLPKLKTEYCLIQVRRKAEAAGAEIEEIKTDKTTGKILVKLKGALGTVPTPKPNLSANLSTSL